MINLLNNIDYRVGVGLIGAASVITYGVSSRMRSETGPSIEERLERFWPTKLPQWPAQSAFDQLEAEAQLLNPKKVSIISLFNIPVIGDIFYLIYRIAIIIYRLFIPLKRQIPAIGIQDEIIVGPNGIFSPHMNDPNPKSFQDYQILRVHSLTKSLCLAPKITIPNPFFPEIASIDVSKDENGRFILLQTGLRSCSAAVSAMLILDAGKQCNINDMRQRSLASTETVMSDLRKASLTPLSSQVNSAQEFSELIEKNGSAIVSIGGSIGGHFIVVDAIQRNTVSIRDPFHGWSATIPLSAFLSCSPFSEPIIQVLKP